MKQAIDKSIKPSGPKDLFSTTGFHTIDSNPHIINFGERLPVYLNVYESNSTKFHNLSRQLTDQFQEIAKTLTELSMCARHFSKMYKL